MITLKQLADIMELSPSTVSKSLNNSSEISLKTKNRVRKYASVHRYVPNKAAQSLRGKKTKNLGIVMPNIRDDFFGMVLHEIENEARKQDYNLIIRFSDDLLEREKEGLDNLIKGSVDGILISMAKETQVEKQYEHIDQALLHNCPVVMFDRVEDELLLDKIVIDDFLAAYRATQHLLKTGCKRVAFLSTISKTSVSDLRKKGYLGAISQESEDIVKPIYIEIEDYADFAEIFKTAIDMHNFDAVLAADELSGLCTLNTAQRLGLCVPEHISVIGFNDGQNSKFSNPPLTVVSQYAEEIGRKAVQKLLQRIKTGPEYNPETVTIDTDLIIRGTTRPLAQS